jgi:hypothetical protein
VAEEAHVVRSMFLTAPVSVIVAEPGATARLISTCFSAYSSAYYRCGATR